MHAGAASCSIYRIDLTLVLVDKVLCALDLVGKCVVVQETETTRVHLDWVIVFLHFIKFMLAITSCQQHNTHKQLKRLGRSKVLRVLRTGQVQWPTWSCSICTVDNGCGHLCFGFTSR